MIKVSHIRCPPDFESFCVSIDMIKRCIIYKSEIQTAKIYYGSQLFRKREKDGTERWYVCVCVWTEERQEKSEIHIIVKSLLHTAHYYAAI